MYGVRVVCVPQLEYIYISKSKISAVGRRVKSFALAQTHARTQRQTQHIFVPQFIH